MARNEEAIDCYDRALQMNPHDELTLYNKGNSLAALGRFDEAIESYDRAIGISPLYEDAWHNKGAALWHLARFREALPCFEEAQRLGHPNAREAIAMCHEVLAEGR
ncbi:MAG: tetratricopeptide repeat protein [Blastocatellia bacterium]